MISPTEIVTPALQAQNFLDLELKKLSKAQLTEFHPIRRVFKPLNK